MTQKKQFLKSVSLTMFLFVTSRLLGLFRDLFLASTLGFSYANDLVSKTFHSSVWIRDIWKHEVFVSSFRTIEKSVSSLFHSFFSSMIYLWGLYILTFLLLHFFFQNPILLSLAVFSPWIFGEWISHFMSSNLKHSTLSELDVLFAIVKNLFWISGIAICFFFGVHDRRASFIILSISSTGILIQILLGLYLSKQTLCLVSPFKCFPHLFYLVKISFVTTRTFFSERVRSFWMLFILNYISIEGFFSHFFFIDKFISLPIIFFSYISFVFILEPSFLFFKSNKRIHRDFIFFCFWFLSFYIIYLTFFYLYFPSIISLFVPKEKIMFEINSHSFIILFCIQVFLVFLFKLIFLLCYSSDHKLFFEKLSWGTLLTSIALSSPILYFHSFFIFFVANIVSYSISIFIALIYLRKIVLFDFHYEHLFLPIICLFCFLSIYLSFFFDLMKFVLVFFTVGVVSAVSLFVFQIKQRPAHLFK